MKIILSFFFLSILSFKISAQSFPEVEIKDSEFNTFSTQQIIKESFQKPIVVSFWASWCVSCINELSAVNDEMTDWQDQISFDLYAISIDDSRAAKRAITLSNGKAWDFHVLLDTNQDLKRALNIINIPFLVIVKNGEIVYTKVSYTKGSESEILTHLQEIK